MIFLRHVAARAKFPPHGDDDHKSRRPQSEIGPAKHPMIRSAGDHRLTAASRPI
jgi:hypothetical protein